MRRFYWVILVVVFAGCAQQDPLTDLRAFIDEIESRPKAEIPPPPEFTAVDFVSYTASGKRSPFEIPRKLELEEKEVAQPKSNVRPDPNRVAEYLESFRVENISMVGTLTGIGSDGLWALVKDGNGEIHRVQVGNYLGRNHGRIIGISETQIEMIEIVSSGQDSWVERPRVIVLSGLEQ